MKIVVLAVTLGMVSACAPKGGIVSERPTFYVERLSTSYSGSPAVALSRWASGRQIFLLDNTYRLTKTITLKNGPTGGGDLAFDPRGDLYDADSGGPNPTGQYLLIFAPPYDTPTTRIFFPHHVADSIAIDGKTGVFAVLANAAEMSDDPEVVFFPAGSTKPCAVVVLANGTVLGGGASFDAESDLFFTQYVGPNQNLVSISGECRPGAPITYTPPIPGVDGGPQFNTFDQLVLNKGFYDVVYTYAHPAHGSLGKLLKTTTLNKAHGSYVAMVALSSNGKALFAIPYFQKGAYVYKYPSGGNFTKEIALPAGVSSIAVNPPLTP